MYAKKNAVSDVHPTDNYGSWGERIFEVCTGSLISRNYCLKTGKNAEGEDRGQYYSSSEAFAWSETKLQSKNKKIGQDKVQDYGWQELCVRILRAS